ncbi:hypothetical protein niasHT_032591 [Heterodera trifolii]|uniref:Uncharacterized protein n=1 Tax=Heterodera trifolii TaxID=157864 RepID=A0ABD2ISZ3_9BILA
MLTPAAAVAVVGGGQQQQQQIAKSPPPIGGGDHPPLSEDLLIPPPPGLPMQRTLFAWCSAVRSFILSSHHRCVLSPPPPMCPSHCPIRFIAFPAQSLPPVRRLSAAQGAKRQCHQKI